MCTFVLCVVSCRDEEEGVRLSSGWGCVQTFPFRVTKKEEKILKDGQIVLPFLNQFLWQLIQSRNRTEGASKRGEREREKGERQ